MTQAHEAVAREHDAVAAVRTPAHDPGAAQIADAMAATWYEVDAALAPIIGSNAVAALYKRSLYLAGRTHPWLAGAHEEVQVLDVAVLKALVARQASDEAAIGSRALLQTFDQLLVSLIGPSLTERLLRSARASASCGASEQPAPR